MNIWNILRIYSPLLKKTAIFCCLLLFILQNIPVSGTAGIPADFEGEDSQLVNWQRVSEKVTLNEKYDFLASEYQRIFREYIDTLNGNANNIPLVLNNLQIELENLDINCTLLDFQKWAVLNHSPGINEILSDPSIKVLLEKFDFNNNYGYMISSFYCWKVYEQLTSDINSVNRIFFDNFENGMTSWGVLGDKTKINVIQDPGNNKNKLLEITTGEERIVGLECDLKLHSTKVQIEWEAKLPTLNVRSSVGFNFLGINCLWGWNGGNQDFVCHSSAGQRHLVPLKAEKWHTFRLIVDSKNNVYDFYLDGVRKLKDISFIFMETNHINKLHIKVFNSDTSVFVDNIKVSNF